MNLLVFGSLGMLGRDLMAEFSRDCAVAGVDQAETDITRLDACMERVNGFHPEIIFNAAALTHVDYCETHEAEAYSVKRRIPAGRCWFITVRIMFSTGSNRKHTWRKMLRTR